MNRSTQNSAPTKAWPPGELDNYDPQYFETYGQESRADLKRFGVLARCLAGGGDTTQFVEVDNRWSVNPALRDLKPMVLGLARGGHIVDVGAGRGEPAAGMLLELEASGITGTRYLTTDLGDYSAFPDTVDGLAYELAKYPPGRRIYIDPPEDYYKPWTDTYIDQSKWGGLRERVIRRYGDDWDATEPGIFDRAQEALGG